MASQVETNRRSHSNSKLDDVPQSRSDTTLAAADTEAGIKDGSFNVADEDKGTTTVVTFPEGGTRGWATAAGAAGVLFCTFGYINTFGYVFNSNSDFAIGYRN